MLGVGQGGFGNKGLGRGLDNYTITNEIIIDSGRRGQNQGKEGTEAGHPGVHRDADRLVCRHLDNTAEDLGCEELRASATYRAHLQASAPGQCCHD